MNHVHENPYTSFTFIFDLSFHLQCSIYLRVFFFQFGSFLSFIYIMLFDSMIWLCSCEQQYRSNQPTNDIDVCIWTTLWKEVMWFFFSELWLFSFSACQPSYQNHIQSWLFFFSCGILMKEQYCCSIFLFLHSWQLCVKL